MEKIKSNFKKEYTNSNWDEIPSDVQSMISKVFQDINNVYVKANIQPRYKQPDSLEIKLNKIELLETVKSNIFNLIKLRVKLNLITDDLILKLETLINNNVGKSNLEFYVEDDQTNQIVKLYSKKNKVGIDSDFLEKLGKIPEIKYDLN